MDVQSKIGGAEQLASYWAAMQTRLEALARAGGAGIAQYRQEESQTRDERSAIHPARRPIESANDGCRLSVRDQPSPRRVARPYPTHCSRTLAVIPRPLCKRKLLFGSQTSSLTSRLQDRKQPHLQATGRSASRDTSASPAHDTMEAIACLASQSDVRIRWRRREAAHRSPRTFSRAL